MSDTAHFATYDCDLTIIPFSLAVISEGDTVLEGSFQERANDFHVIRRNALLSSHRAYPQPGVTIAQIASTAPLQSVVKLARSSLERDGLALMQFETLPSHKQFKMLGEGIGTLMPETDPSVQKFVDDSVILNLVSVHSHHQDTALQPFSTDFLSLHTECSARILAEQPRYLMLLCLDAGDDATRAQTVLVPMSAVASGISERALQLLQTTRYRHCLDGPMIARSTANGPAFSFRDFRSNQLDWINNHDNVVNEEEVQEAIRALLSSMYDTGQTQGIHWQRGLLVVFDNFRFFHGRTSGAVVPSERKRHLIRLRITSNF